MDRATPARPLTAWPEALEATIAERCRIFTGVRVLAETGSTQDAARELSDQPGMVVVAARQTRGRGRLGRSWNDTGDEGIAVTFVAPDATLEGLILASSVAAARAVARHCPHAVGIKWPNDLLLRGRKLGGILIERIHPGAGGPVALIGIGINVRQERFPDELAALATSLAIEGVSCDRLDLLCSLVSALDEALRATADALLAEYLDRDVLRGCAAVFATPTGEVSGEVLRAHPLEGVDVLTAAGPVRLAIATTTVLAWRSPEGRTVDKRGIR